MTPYAYNESSLENPSILVSHDGINWATPNGLINPIDRVGGAAYHSDTDLILHDGTLYCFYRLTSGGVTVPRYRTSRDGVHWSPLTEISTDDAWTSMSIAYHGGQWHCFYTYTTGTRTIGHRTAPSPEGPWSPATPGVLHNFPSNRALWHLDVTRHGGRWLAAIMDGYVGSTGSNGKFVLASSTDGVNWACTGHVMGPGAGEPAETWDSAGLYRPSFYVEGDTVHLYYGGQQRSDIEGRALWWIGKTTVPLKAFPG